MSHACHRFWKCYKTLTFCSLLAGCKIPCACRPKRRFNVQKWREHVAFCTFWLWNVLRATRVYTFWASQLPKLLCTWCVLYILTSKCASRHNGIRFLNISTDPGPSVFNTVDFEMCFAPQWRALFQHLNRPRQFLTLLTSKCASRHNGVHFFDISTSKSAPKPRCFVHFDFEMCFVPQRRAIVHLSSGQMAPRPPL